MTHRMIYLVGAPGSGKSTLMSRLTDHFMRQNVAGTSTAPAHDVLYFQEFTDGKAARGAVAGAELGIRREAFGGTDALPASIIEKAIPWIQTTPFELIFAEGARLANIRFLQAAADAGYDVHLAVLAHPEIEEWRAERSKKLGKVQSPAWVKGRTTATNNLAEHFMRKPELGVKVYVGHPVQLLEDLEHLLG